MTYSARLLAILVHVCLLAIVGTSHAGDQQKVPRIQPVASVWLSYPNKWDSNNQIALSKDGSRLIDAALGARNIRVWDWDRERVAQRLLLNDEAPEGYSRKGNKRVLGISLGQELALSSDGGMVAACVNILRKGQFEKASKVRVWNLQSGSIVNDIMAPMHRVPGFDQDAVLPWNCQSISFSPDAKYMAVLILASKFANEDDFRNQDANFNAKTGQYKEGKRPIWLTGIALYETKNWQLQHLYYRLDSEQKVNSRPLFDPESKTVSAVVFDRAPPNPKRHRLGLEWAGNSIVRWDIATGTLLEEKEVPQLVDSPSSGVWWTPLPGGREVWWQTGNGTIQTKKEADQCEQETPPPPKFFSDKKKNCKYEWSLMILNIDTGKIRYLAPFKRDTLVPKGIDEFSWGSISPDGAHIILVQKKQKSNDRLRASGSVEIRSMDTFQLEGRYSADNLFKMETVYSTDSRYFSFRAFKSRNWISSALIFELPKKK